MEIIILAFALGVAVGAGLMVWARRMVKLDPNAMEELGRD